MCNPLVAGFFSFCMPVKPLLERTDFLFSFLGGFDLRELASDEWEISGFRAGGENGM